MHIYYSIFDKLIWRTIGPKSFLFRTAQFSLWASGTVNYIYSGQGDYKLFHDFKVMFIQPQTIQCNQGEKCTVRSIT